MGERLRVRQGALGGGVENVLRLLGTELGCQPQQPRPARHDHLGQQQIERGPVVLHLSEHYGDCSPGAKVFVNTDDVEALHRELWSRPNPNMRPGVELAPWNAKVLEVTDPFGNRLCFNQPLPRA